MQRSVISRMPEAPSEAPPLLFVHGAWHGAWCWDEYLLPWFADQGFEAHALDLRGHGAADNDRPLWRTRISHYVEDVAAAVSSMERPPVLIGHSMGGLVVQKYLEDHTLPGAVLLAPVPIRGALGVTLRTIRRHPIAFLKANLTFRLWHIVGTPRLARRRLFGTEMSEGELHRHFGRLQDESYLAYLDMILRRPRPWSVDSPVLVIAGTHDGIFTIDEMQATARAYGAEPVMIPGGVHDLMLDARWMEMGTTIRDWINRSR